MHIRKLYAVTLSLVILLVLSLAFTAMPALADGPNLLQNPGFEAPFTASIPGKENCLIAEPWLAWYTEGSPDLTSQGYLLAPEYKMSTTQDYPGNRVHGGWLAQQYFHSFGNFQAGVYQVVNNITPGSYLHLTMWVMTWSCDNESKGNCSGAVSGDPSAMHLRIGIDPDGGTDPYAGEIVWTSEVNAYDAWQQLQVEATATGPSVTVFVYSYPDYRSQDNNVYLDDASLVVVAPPATNTPIPTDTLEPSPTPEVTDTPTPTDTPEPTATPEPTNTRIPTVTAQPSKTATVGSTKVVEAVATAAPTTAATSAPTQAAPTAAPTEQPQEQTLWQKLAANPGVILLVVALILVIAVLVISLVNRKRRQSYR